MDFVFPPSSLISCVVLSTIKLNLINPLIFLYALTLFLVLYTPKKLLLYASTYMKIHCKNINTSHLIELSGAQSQPTTRCCCSDTTHHLCRIPPSLHRAISMCGGNNSRKINRFSSFFSRLVVMLLPIFGLVKCSSKKAQNLPKILNLNIIFKF